MRILMTAGMEFIGSHAAVPLAEKECELLTPLDNLCNSQADVLGPIERISGSRPIFSQGIKRDSFLLDRVLQGLEIRAAMHFACLKAVGESVQKPLENCGIPVMDLAEGHLAALNYLNTYAGHTTVYLGRGEGVSVLDLVHAFEHVSGRNIPLGVVKRRPGDLAQCWADPTLAKILLGWHAKRDLDVMRADSCRWQQFSESASVCAI